MLPTLYKKTSKGKIQTWHINVPDLVPHDHDHLEPAEIVTTYGLLDGKMQVASETISEGKNIGKVNETTPYEQAQLEAKSQWEKKVKKGYVQSIEDAQADKIDTNLITGGVEPMLAQGYDKHAAKISWPAYVQPKLDGHRCIAIIQDGVCTLWSRTRKPITGVPHIARQIEKRFPGKNLVLDGELYNHAYKDKFEQLTSFIRQETPKPGHEVVQYWVYDIVMDGDFGDRARQIADLEINDGNILVEVPTSIATDEEEMIAIFGVYINAGFEGLMVRNSAGPYKNKRSYDLQKVKVFQDAEFEVLDVEEGKGKMAGKAMFVVDNPFGTTEDAKTFRVKMMGSLDNLAEIYKNKDEYLNRMLTVKYQKLSKDGVPIFPVAMRFREDI